MEKKITRKGMRSKVREGCTIEDCLHEYGFSNEEEFLTELQKLYGKDTSTWETIYSGLKKNGAARDKSGKEEPAKTALEIALERKAAITQTISRLSSEMEILSAKREETASGLAQVNSRLAALLAKVDEQRKIAAEILQELEENEASLSKKNCEYTAAKAEEAKIENRINMLNVIKIAFYVPDGNCGEYQYVAKENIAVENDELLKNQMASLIYKDEVSVFLGNFGIDQLEALAEILLIADKVKKAHPDTSIELVFEEASELTEILEVKEMKVKVINQ